MTTLAKMAMGLAILSIAATVEAGDRPSVQVQTLRPGPGYQAPKNDVAALEDSRDMVAWEARNAKGIEHQQLRAEEQHLQGLIDSLRDGGRVDPSEVDRALNRTR